MVESNKKNNGGVTGKGFVPGQSGNPGGRPKGSKGFRERCREFMDSEGLESLIEIARNPRDKNRFRAIELIAGYSWGRPKQGIELTGEEGNDINITIKRV